MSILKAVIIGAVVAQAMVGAGWEWIAKRWRNYTEVYAGEAELAPLLTWREAVGMGFSHVAMAGFIVAFVVMA